MQGNAKNTAVNFSHGCILIVTWLGLVRRDLEHQRFDNSKKKSNSLDSLSNLANVIPVSEKKVTWTVH